MAETTNKYTCAICDQPINKNHESYRGRMSMGMLAAIRKETAGFHPKDDICKPCGERFASESAGKGPQPAWLSSRIS